MSENTNFPGYPEWVKTPSDEDLCEGDSRVAWQAERNTNLFLLNLVVKGSNFRDYVLATLHGVPINPDTMKRFPFDIIEEVKPGIYEQSNYLLQGVPYRVFETLGSLDNVRVSEVIGGTEIMGSFEDIHQGQIVEFQEGPNIQFDDKPKSWAELTDSERRFADFFDASSTVFGIKIHKNSLRPDEVQ